jgi:hypothetical protein
MEIKASSMPLGADYICVPGIKVIIFANWHE